MTDIDVSLRLDLIQAAVNVLSKRLSDDEFQMLTDYIEGLCRHRDLPIYTGDIPECVQKALATQ